jgi:hypothetical protein
MAEPASTSTGASAAVLLIALLGPLAGQYALIVMAALAGALWPLSTMEGLTRRTGAFFLARVVFTACVLTGTAAWWLESRYQLPATQGMAVVAFFIGGAGNGWRPVLAAAGNALAYLVGRLAGKPDDKPSGGTP